MFANTKQQPKNYQRPLRDCEICGKEHMQEYGYSISCFWATTGHAYVSAHGCAAIQHFCCSPECAIKAAHKCIDEHLPVMLQLKYAEVNFAGKPRYAVEDEYLKEYGPDFHLTENQKGVTYGNNSNPL